MMGLPDCREITRLVLEGEDRPLGHAERLTVRAHYLICKGCTNFGKQVELMRRASKHWRSYSGNSDGGNSDGGNSGSGNNDSGNNDSGNNDRSGSTDN